MHIRFSLAVAAVAAAMTQASSAAMVTFTNATLWGAFSASRGATTVAETFNSYSGNYASGLTGNAGDFAVMPVPPGNLPSAHKPDGKWDILLSRASLIALRRHLQYCGETEIGRAHV